MTANPYSAIGVLFCCLSMSSLSFAQELPAREVIVAFENISILKVRSNKSYILQIKPNTAAPSLVMVQCHSTARAYTVMLTAPDQKMIGAMNDRQIVTIWADGKNPIDLSFITFNRNIAIAGDQKNAPAESIYNTRKIVEVLGAASKTFSYSMGQYSASFDITNLPAARTRFAQLCALPFDE